MIPENAQIIKIELSRQEVFELFIRAISHTIEMTKYNVFQKSIIEEIHKIEEEVERIVSGIKDMTGVRFLVDVKVSEQNKSEIDVEIRGVESPEVFGMKQYKIDEWLNDNIPGAENTDKKKIII